MRIAAYCRVSTDKSDQMNSLEAQKEFFSEYARKEGHELVRLYADEGISGTKIKNRKAFQSMMKDARNGLFDMIVTKDFSRFARNTVDFLQSVRELKGLGINIIFLSSNMAVLGESEFLLTIFGAMAQQESANTSSRIKFGKKVNAKKGRVPNIVYGYDKTVGDYFNLRVNEKEAEIVRQIFDWYVNGGFGASKIANMLNERGVKTKRNCKWTQNAVCRILTNKLYTGKLINGKQEVVDFLSGKRVYNDESKWFVFDRPELQIVEPDLFEKAQREMKSRGQAFKVDKERHSNRYLFSTLIKCKECGWSFRRMVRTYKNTYVRWVCSGHNGKGANNCPNAVTIDEEELISKLNEYFKKLLENKNYAIKNLVKEFERIYKEKADSERYAENLQAQLEKIQNSREKYMKLYESGLISIEEFAKKTSGTLEEIARIEKELKYAQASISKADQLEKLIRSTFKSIEDVVSVREMTNAQLKQIVKKIDVDRHGNVDIYLCLQEKLGIETDVLISNYGT